MPGNIFSGIIQEKFNFLTSKMNDEIIAFNLVFLRGRLFSFSAAWEIKYRSTTKRYGKKWF